MVLSDKIFKTVLENITPKKPPVLLDGWNPASPKRNNTSKSWEIAWMKYLSTGQPNFSHHQYQWRNWCHQKISFLPATVAQHLHTQRTSWQVLKLSGSENKKQQHPPCWFWKFIVQKSWDFIILYDIALHIRGLKQLQVTWLRKCFGSQPVNCSFHRLKARNVAKDLDDQK